MGDRRKRWVELLTNTDLGKHGTLRFSDFTKQYNRLRQHVAVRTGHAQGVSSSINRSTSVVALPAVNRPRTADAGTSLSKDKTADQLTILSKYSSRIAQIDAPYNLGVSVNRKGPSSYANAKDKSDRATSEQVLDPRTRIILFKMIGRGMIHEVNGCISTGKEVSTSACVSFIFLTVLHIGKCISCSNSRIPSPRPQNLQNIYPHI